MPTMEIPRETCSLSPGSAKKRSFEELEDTAVTCGIESIVGSKTATGPNTGVTEMGGRVSGHQRDMNPKVPTAITTSPSTSPTKAMCGGAVLTTGTITSANIAPNSVLIPIPAPNTNARLPSPVSAATFPTPNKKQKQSLTSKEAKLLEKEAREKQRAEERARKEEERREKEEERKKREGEREEERKKREERKRIKDEERVAREEEKKKKEEDKMKKERSQMRLNAFFSKPIISNSNPATISENKVTQETGAKPTTNCGENTNADGNVDNVPVEKKVLSDYEREFPAFFLQSHVKLAPLNRFERDAETLKHVHDKVDIYLKKHGVMNGSPTAAIPLCPSQLFQIMPYTRRRGIPNVPTVKEIITTMQGSPMNTIDLTRDEAVEHGKSPTEFLKEIPVKILKFSQDVRPPYQGTFTKRLPERSAHRLCRNPFARIVPDFNYEYDSEAEWEEPEEGEELNSEGEEDMSEDGDEDMDGFLDDGDEDPVNGKRRIIVGDLEPVCSGIHWDDGNQIDTVFKPYRMEIISESHKFPIDPFSIAYWQKPVTQNRSPQKLPGQNSGHHHNHTSIPSHDMKPPAIPSKHIHPNGRSPPHVLTSSTSAMFPISSISDSTQPVPVSSVIPGVAGHKAGRTFPPGQVAEFREIVDGSNLTKIGLVEVLKKRFPKISKDLIKETLGAVAVRCGQKEADKKWVLR